MDTKTALQRAVTVVGSQKALADAIGVSQQTVWAWIDRESLPAEHCPPIERATLGAVTCEELRPDLAEQFAYLRSTGAKQAA